MANVPDEAIKSWYKKSIQWKYMFKLWFKIRMNQFTLFTYWSFCSYFPSNSRILMKTFFKLRTESIIYPKNTFAYVHIWMSYNGVFPKCFTESLKFSDKNICHYSKRARTWDKDATTAPTRHMWEIGSSNWA